MKFLFIAILLFYSSIGNTTEIPPDKEIHFAGGCVISSVSQEIFFSEEPPFYKTLFGVLTTTFFGFAKEEWDKKHPHHRAEEKDIYAGTLGSFCGTFQWQFD